MSERSPLVETAVVSKSFPGRGILGHRRQIHAVREVSAEIARGEVLGVVGESGSGKSTFGRLMLGLIPPSAGAVYIDGKDLARTTRNEMRRLRRRMQIVFQDPNGSLDPRRRVGAQLADGMAIHELVPRGQRRSETQRLLAEVGLEPDHADRYPHEFSGGQRQRIAIARALSTRPDFLVADEPVSALDVSIQAQIIGLLAHLRASRGLSMLFVSHDLPVVKSICDSVLVMYLGRVMEVGAAAEVFAAPRHPYSRALMSATPRLQASARGQRIILPGDPPSPANPPSGCVFRTRCPHARPICAAEVPALRKLDGSVKVACHRAEELG